MERLLTDKTAIITGGASGIGKAIVKEFLLEGARVAVIDNNHLLLGQTRQDLAPLAKQDELVGFVVDISDKTYLEKMVSDIEAKLGHVDILVNNAGINPSSSVVDNPDDEWNRVMAVNLTGSRNMTQIVGRRMVERGTEGSIVFITSIHTGQAFADNCSYDASKHGLLGYMRVVALEWAQYGIRANAVAPGAIYPTGITGGTPSERVAEIATHIPLLRWGKPEDVARVVSFLASDRASYVSGAEWRVDGGLAIKTPLFG